MTAIQIAVVAFFAGVWGLLAVILIAGPDVLGLSAAGIPPLLFFAAVSLLLAALTIASGLTGTPATALPRLGVPLRQARILQRAAAAALKSR